MGLCGRCGTQFPTCYMDTVSTCPNCGTTFYNDSPGLLTKVASEPPANWVPRVEKKTSDNK